MLELLSNGSFERGWLNVAARPGLINQVPVGWTVTWAQPGETLLSACVGPDDPPVMDTATVVPECVHMEAGQLPPEERPGGERALILDGVWCYKVFAAGGAFSVRMVAEVVSPDGGWLRAVVPIQVHQHGDGSPGAAMAQIVLSGRHGPWLTFGGGLRDRAWAWPELTERVRVGQEVRLEVILEGRAEAGIDFFLDAVSLQLTPYDGVWKPVDYVVVANLLPQDATAIEVARVLGETFHRRETVLYSADDAARLVAPGPPGSLVRVWAPERWEGDVIGWLVERGVATVEAASFDSWHTDEPEEPEEEPEEEWRPRNIAVGGSRVGWHAVGNCGLPELYEGRGFKAPVIKLVQAIHDVARMPAWWRIVRLIDWPGYGNLEGFDYRGDPERQAEARIAVLAEILEPYAGQFDYAEYVNEQDIPSAELAIQMGRFAKRAAEVAPRWMRLLHFSFGTGNPGDLRWWDGVAESGAFEAIAEAGHGIALHAYYDHRSRAQVGAHLLRYRYLYEHYIHPRRLDIPLFLTECGPWENLLDDPTFDLMAWIRVTDERLDEWVLATLYTVSDVDAWRTYDRAVREHYDEIIAYQESREVERGQR